MGPYSRIKAAKINLPRSASELDKELLHILENPNTYFFHARSVVNTGHFERRSHPLLQRLSLIQTIKCGRNVKVTFLLNFPPNLSGSKPGKSSFWMGTRQHRPPRRSFHYPASQFSKNAVVTLSQHYSMPSYSSTDTTTSSRPLPFI